MLLIFFNYRSRKTWMAIKNHNSHVKYKLQSKAPKPRTYTPPIIFITFQGKYGKLKLTMTAIVNVLAQKMQTFFTCLLGFSKYSNTEPQGHTNTEGRLTDKDRHNHLV